MISTIMIDSEKKFNNNILEFKNEDFHKKIDFEKESKKFIKKKKFEEQKINLS